MVLGGVGFGVVVGSGGEGVSVGIVDLLVGWMGLCAATGGSVGITTVPVGSTGSPDPQAASNSEPIKTSANTLW
jgi:hypothetical protein